MLFLTLRSSCKSECLPPIISCLYFTLSVSKGCLVQVVQVVQIRWFRSGGSDDSDGSGGSDPVVQVVQEGELL